MPQSSYLDHTWPHMVTCLGGAYYAAFGGFMQWRWLHTIGSSPGCQEASLKALYTSPQGEMRTTIHHARTHTQKLPSLRARITQTTTAPHALAHPTHARIIASPSHAAPYDPPLRSALPYNPYKLIIDSCPELISTRQKPYTPVSSARGSGNTFFLACSPTHFFFFSVLSIPPENPHHHSPSTQPPSTMPAASSTKRIKVPKASHQDIYLSNPVRIRVCGLFLRTFFFFC
ncbi:hypothetical protein DFH27DRAFT_227424 [Peziza echinospora]|nr:hypothetical protein DFH27DRAFT_227424 [Peziza echinospora]